MRKNIKAIFILITFGIVFVLSGISNYNISSVQEDNDRILEIRDETNLKTSNTDIIILSPEDKIYAGPMDGYYPATYSFDEQAGTNGTDISWIDVDNHYISSIVSEVNGHKNVLELNLTSKPASVRHNITTERNNGTIEFYVMTANNSTVSKINIGDGNETNSIEIVFFFDGKIYCNDKFSSGIFIQNYTNNIWYHFKIEFNCSEDWHLWINNVSKDEGSGYEYMGNPTKFDCIEILQGTLKCFYFDAFGYNWTDYEIGDNLNEGLLLSFENNTNFDWMGYSLDGQANKTILGNKTIPMPDYGQHTIQVFGNDSLGINYESNIRNFYISPINIITPENKTYNKPMRGYYPATYSFDDQEAGTTGTDINFIDKDLNAKASLVSGGVNHKNNLKVQNSGGQPSGHAIDVNPANGTIEFYVMAAQTNQPSMVNINDGGIDKSIHIWFNNLGEIWCLGDDTEKIQDYSAFTWYHFKIKFECDTKGDGTNDWHLWIDGDSMDGGSGYSYVGNPTNMDYIDLQANNGIFYYDAFGFSWDNNYEIGDNMNEGLLLSCENHTNLNWMDYSLDGQPNRTILGNTTIPMPDYGQHTIQVFGNNTFGTIFPSELRQFTIDTIEPNVTIISPTMGIYGPTSLLINASITDDLSTISSAKTMINASMPFNFNISMTQSGTYWWCTWNNISEYQSGDYNITIWAIDEGGNVNQTQFIVITFDKSRPNVTIISPTAGTYHPPSLLINASISDEFSTISSVKAMIEFWVPFNFNISMTQSGTYWFCYWDNISEYQNGNYTIKIWAIDEGGNVNQTQFIVIMIDNPPIVGDGDGNSSDGDKESSEWLLIVIIISAISAVGILSVVSALLIKNRSKPLMMPQSKVPKTCSLCSKKHTEFWILCKECYAKQQKIPVSTICPTCKSKKNIEIPKLLIDEAKTIMTISIPKGLMCDHHFQAFVDKNFKVRGYQKVDFEGNSKQILAKK